VPLARRQRQERPAYVEAVGIAVWPGQLPVEKRGAAAILAAGDFRIGRDQPINQRLDRGTVLSCRELPWS
jgi:hypothetical protein